MLHETKDFHLQFLVKIYSFLINLFITMSYKIIVIIIIHWLQKNDNFKEP